MWPLPRTPPTSPPTWPRTSVGSSKARPRTFSCESGGRLGAAFQPVGVEELASGSVPALIRVGTEVVALGLDQVGGQVGGAERVVERQSGRIRRHRESRPDGC